MSNPVLVVAPFKDMAAKTRRVIRSLGLNIPVVVGNDNTGIEEVGAFADARVLISRGGTSKYLKRSFPDKTVIEIAASFSDISRGIEELIAKGCTNIAVITHENIIGLGSSRISFGAEQVQVIPCEDGEAIEREVIEKVKEGADGIVGCVVAVATARRLNVPSTFIDAENASIKRALLEALAIDAAFESRENAVGQMRTLIDSLEEGIVIFDKRREPVYCNDVARRIFMGIAQGVWHLSLDTYLDGTHRHPHVITIHNRQVVLRTVVLESDSLILAILQEGSIIEQSEKAMRVAALAKGHYAKLSFDDLLFVDPLMRRLVDRARQFARSDSTVLILGATGVGKEGFAQSIHRASPRAQMPFISVNCASLPQSLIASELFGYVGGAFTGASKEGRRGLFEMAQGGTIFLDEITEIPPEVQAQFLRVLQEREVTRVGDDRVIPLDIRVICATNRNLLSLCEAGAFRYDLYYRINVLKLRIPSLSERPSDILPLFKRFIGEELHLSPEEICLEEGVEGILTGYPWPGNVRELKNIAEVCSFGGPRVTLETVSESLTPPDPTREGAGGRVPLYIEPDATADAVLKTYLEELQKHHSLSEMVTISGLSRTTLWRKLRANAAE